MAHLTLSILIAAVFLTQSAQTHHHEPVLHALRNKESKSLPPGMRCDCVATATLYPVCGNNGVTYPHPSYLYCLKTCKADSIDKSLRDLQIAHCGSCENRRQRATIFDDVELPAELLDTFDKCGCNVTREYNPVCSMDELVTYENPSVFYCTKRCLKLDIHIKHCGICARPILGLFEDELEDRCKCTATREYSPVCGCDDNTYANRGVLDCAESCIDKKLKIAYSGICKDKREIVPAESLRRRTRRSIEETVEFYQPQGCSCNTYEGISPICGSDGRSYSSTFKLRCINKCKRANVKVAYNGPCLRVPQSSANEPAAANPSKRCRCYIKKDSKPFCGTDGLTYLNPSHATCLNICKNKSVVKAYDGPCTFANCKCYLAPGMSLLCGSDGETYINPSALTCTNRCEDKYVVKAYNGACTGLRRFS